MADVAKRRQVRPVYGLCMSSDNGHFCEKPEVTRQGRNQPGGAWPPSRPLTIPLERATECGREWVGGKAASLSVLLRGRLPVPPGFCVTSDAFRLWLNSSPQLQEWLGKLGNDGGSPTAEPRKPQRAVPEPTEMPESVKEAVLSAWRGLGEERCYAVRSSATVEDGKRHSFAGQFESVLNVRGGEALLHAITKCWLSAFSPRALSYHAANGLRPEQTAVAVVVQEMVPAQTAGVVFTLDPVSGNTGRLVIEATTGLAEGLVSGKARAEHFVVEKRSRRLVAQHGVSGAPCLSEALRRKIAGLALRAESLFGSPLDLEWAAAGGEVFLLQARPVTGAGKPQTWAERQRWSNVNTGEVFPDVTTPMTWSIVQSLFEPLFGSLFRLAGADPSRVTVGGLVAGRIYFNVNTGLALLRPFQFLVGGLAKVAHAVGGARPAEHMGGLLAVPEADIPDAGFRWYRYVFTWPRVLYLLCTHAPWCAAGWLRRVQARTDQLVTQDIEPMNTRELLSCLARARREGFRDWDLLYLITQAAALPVFERACQKWLNQADPSRSYRLFAGLGGIPEAEAGLALWRLAARVHADRELERLFRDNVGFDWAQLQAKLTGTAAGRAFLAAWSDFMSKHGHHCRGELELFNARWHETPDYILRVVCAYLANLEEANPDQKQQRLAQERRKLTYEWRAQLGPAKRWLFSYSLERAQRLTVQREVWKNEAVRMMAFLRRVLLALGRRLREQGALEQADDIFFLEIAEVEALSGKAAATDLRRRIEVRREQYRQNLAHSPPPSVVGCFTPGSPLNARSASRSTATVLEGIAVSSGVATGRARVILRSDVREQVQPGEILVAPFTDPAWVPYFIPAAGLVVDQGGVLSHGSIVARELGLPAVTDTGAATQTIKTGDLVEVDGNLGRVRILERVREPRLSGSPPD